MVKEATHLTGTSRLRQASDQISSLILLSHSIKVFSSKWNLIRNKLNEILPILGVLPPVIQDSGDNTTFSGIIKAIEETTEFSTKLAQKCLDLSYSGKLLMQSDLDITCVRFNNHIKSLSELSSTDGVSNGYYAIVVSRPGPTASRDDMKFYVKDVLSRFKIGSSEMKKRALINFNEVVQEDVRYVKIAMEIDGFVYALMEFLSSKEAGIQEEALKTVDIICGFDSYKGVLVGIGVVAPLIRALEGESGTSKELSTRCLMKVTADSDNAWSVSAHGGVTALLRICAGGCENGGELVGLACVVLKNLIGVEEIKRFTVEEEGVIPMFINLVSSRSEFSQISSIEFLQAIASGDELVTSLIVNQGGVRVLISVLDPNSSFSSKTRVTSIRAIMRLCSNPTRLSSLTSYSFLDHVLYFLQNGEVLVQESSLKAAFWLSGTSDEFKKAMGDAGFMPEVLKFVAAKSFDVQEIASETLLSLVSVPRNRKRFVEDDQNVSLLLQLIDPEEGSSGNRKLLLSIIMCLTSCNSGRRKILSCGYFKNVENLADEQVLDAKKIVRNVSSNRFVSIIRGIWW